MKRATSLILLFCFLFSGCKSQKTVSFVTKGIKFDLKVAYGEADYEATVSIDNGGCMEAVINAPEKIKGIKITSDKFETKAEYKDLKHTYNEEGFAGDNPIITVYNVLSNLSDMKLPLKEGENCVVEGELSKDKYEFVFSPSGLPISFNMSSKNLSVVFCNVAVLKKE